MAKFAQVGYGHDGRGIGVNGYTYIVDDSVRAGDIIVPISAFNVWAGRDIQTMAKVVSTTKNLEKKGEKNITVPTKDGGEEEITYTNEDIKKGLKRKDLGTSLDDHKGLKSTVGTKSTRNYGNADQFENRLAQDQEKMTQTNAERSAITEVFRGKTNQEYSKKQKELQSAFSGETYDNYAKKFQ